MRFILLIIVALTINRSIFAQTPRQGAFAEAGTSLVGLQDKSVVMGRVSFGWLPVSHCVIGAIYSFSPNNISLPEKVLESFSYGGLFVEYDLPLTDPIGLRFQILAAGGGTRFVAGGIINFLMYEPAILIDYKLSPDASVSAGFGYGFASGVDEQNYISTTDLSKFRVSISMRYGISIFSDGTSK